jgi:cysteine-rich repeat protein
MFLLILFAACTSGTMLQLPPPSPSPELTLEVTALEPGQVAAWTVGGLSPNEQVYIGRAAQVAPGPCLAAAGGLCLEIGPRPVLLGTATADASGEASLQLALPGTLPLGLGVAFEAVVIRGVGGSSSAHSPTVTRVVGEPLPIGVEELVPGDLVITEIMKDPTLVSDAFGEWFEVFNAAGVAVDLHGLLVSDLGSDHFEVTGSLVVAAGGRVVLGASADPAVNGGVPVDWAWARFTLANGGDEIVLANGAGIIDVVAYDDGVTWPHHAGSSLSLDGALVDAALNDVGHRWCEGGTPGAPNAACPIVAWCGDGAVDPGEMCDDGGSVSGDGCSDACQGETCRVEIERGVRTWDATGGSLGSPAARSTATLPDGSGWWVGTVRQSNYTYPWVARVGVGGEVRWAKRYATGLSFSPQRVLPDATGAWVVGEMVDFQTRDTVVVIRLNDVGDLLWARTVAPPYSSYNATPYDALITSDGGLVVVGGLHEEVVPPRYSAFATRFDSNGQVLWFEGYNPGMIGGQTLRGVVEVDDGFVMVGQAGYLVWLFGLTPTGGLRWSRFAELSGGVGSVLTVQDARPVAGGLLAVGTRTDAYTRGAFALAFDFEAGATGTDIALRWAQSIDGGPVAESSSYLGALASPAPCDAPAVDGQVCGAATTCATADGASCRCDGTWTCEADGAEVLLAWADAHGEVNTSRVGIDGALRGSMTHGLLAPVVDLDVTGWWWEAGADGAVHASWAQGAQRFGLDADRTADPGCHAAPLAEVSMAPITVTLTTNHPLLTRPSFQRSTLNVTVTDASVPGTAAASCDDLTCAAWGM